MTADDYSVGFSGFGFRRGEHDSLFSGRNSKEGIGGITGGVAGGGSPVRGSCGS